VSVGADHEIEQVDQPIGGVEAVIGLDVGAEDLQQLVAIGVQLIDAVLILGPADEVLLAGVADDV
jgi:hypothetical protein